MSWDGDALVGSSTDGAGFVASLDEAGVDVDGQRWRSSAPGAQPARWSMRSARAGSIDIAILNRHRQRPTDAVALTALPRSAASSDIGRADIVVNATSVGMGRRWRTSPVIPAFSEAQVVADLVYHPLETAVARPQPSGVAAPSTGWGCWSTRRPCSNGSGSATTP